MTDLPAYARTGWYDVLAANRLGAALLPGLAPDGPDTPNLARYLFLDQRAHPTSALSHLKWHLA